MTPARSVRMLKAAKTRTNHKKVRVRAQAGRRAETARYQSIQRRIGIVEIRG